MKLYQSTGSPFAARVRLAIYYKGLAVDLIQPPQGGFNKSPEYLAINPIGKIPSLRLEDGSILPESTAILEYLEDKFPEPPLLPTNPEARAHVRLICQLAEHYVAPLFRRFFGQWKLQQHDDAATAEAVTDARRVHGYLDHYLGAGSFASGEDYTLGDCALVPLLFYIELLGEAVGADGLLDGGRLGAYWVSVRTEAATARVIEELRVSWLTRQSQR